MTGWHLVDSLSSDDISTQREWSFRTFGPGERLEGVLSHLFKELEEIGGHDTMMNIVGTWLTKDGKHQEGSPKAADEWADLLILAIDGAMRQGIEPGDLLEAYHSKMNINMHVRTWPDWRDFGQDEAIEHVREG